MEDVTHLVAENLKRIREEKKLSLEKLAELTGVSKSMLGQIERGDSSPTISTVWKISNGLKVSFTSLLNVPQSETTLIRRTDIQPMIEDDGRYQLFPLFPIEEGRRFEVYSIEIEPGGHLTADAHPDGTQEFLTVYSGTLIVKANMQDHQLAEGDSIRFRADKPHAYQNPGDTLAKINLVIHYTG
jgi:XRE family transcriptional regulator, regulator of sulfur utilization